MSLTLQRIRGAADQLRRTARLVEQRVDALVGGDVHARRRHSGGPDGQPFIKASALGAGAVHAYLLPACLQDVHGLQLKFAAVKILRVTADIADADDLGPGGS